MFGKHVFPCASMKVCLLSVRLPHDWSNAHVQTSMHLFEIAMSLYLVMCFNPNWSQIRTQKSYALRVHFLLGLVSFNIRERKKEE